MFGFIKSKVTDVAEGATGMDLDGDGKAGKKSGSGGTGGAGGLSLGSATSMLSSLAFPKNDAGGVDLDDGYALPVSDCTGNKKSLFVGINYFGQKGELRGCLNDVVNMKELIMSKYGFADDAEHMLVLTDDQEGANAPTRENIERGMRWLIEGAQEGDSLFFHYSGHGGTTDDVSPESDEADGKDETLIPVDYQANGVIVDDEIHETLVAPLPKGVRLTAVMDCCHSGSIFDLPFSYQIDGSLHIIETDNRKKAIEAAIKAGKALICGDKLQAAMHSASAVWNLVKQDDPSAGRPMVVRKSLADVVQFSGCKDEQTSADAHIDGEHTGAMSWALIGCLNEFGLEQTYSELLGNIRTKLATKYTQVPQMSSGHKMNMSGSKFHM